MVVIAGELRHKIEIKRLTIIKDEYGAANEMYITTNTFKAGVKYLSGTKTIDNNQIFTTQTNLFTTWYRNIISTDRILFEGKTFKINSIEEIGYKEGLNIIGELINE